MRLIKPDLSLHGNVIVQYGCEASPVSCSRSDTTKRRKTYSEPGQTELIIILVIVLIIFGAGRRRNRWALGKRREFRDAPDDNTTDGGSEGSGRRSLKNQLSPVASSSLQRRFTNQRMLTVGRTPIRKHRSGQLASCG
jgi:Sec-independent protein translocase protein TatA